MVSLTLVSGPQAGANFAVEREAVIGRWDADITIDDEEISRRHARVTPIDRGIRVEDLGSRNGTWLNGERLAEPATARDGDQLGFGATVAEVRVSRRSARTRSSGARINGAGTGLSENAGGRVAHLRVRRGRVTGQAIAFHDELVLGRGAPNLPEDPKMSRRHARFHWGTGDTVLVEDLGSTNGTFVNEARVNGEVALKLGDVIRLGATTVELVAAGSAAVAEPPRAPATEVAKEAPPTLLVRWRAAREQRAKLPAFPNYTQIPSLLSFGGWWAVRASGIVATLIVVLLLLADPSLGLRITWGVGIPLLPIMFFVAPGVWRNICPLAASNQIPRVLGWTRALTAPGWLKRYGYLISITMFVLFITLRKVGLERSGPLSALLLVFALVSGFTGGMYLKGKSGWCSSICPLLPVQRIYGQTPFALVGNSHCRPCVGCAKNCYDFNPRVAYLADLNDESAAWTEPRRFFVAAFPGLVLGFFAVPNVPQVSVPTMYGRLAVYVAASIALFFLLDAFINVSTHKLTTLYGAAALNIFYWSAAPKVVQAIGGAVSPAPLTWTLRALVLALTGTWILRTYRKEQVFAEKAGPAKSVSPAGSRSLSRHTSLKAGQPEVTFLPDEKRAVAEPGQTLLELAEGNGLQIEAGCRMGVCGADPVAIVDGIGNLSPVSDDERQTLERLGLAENTRMACCCRVSGPVSVSLEPEQRKRSTPSQLARLEYDRSIEHLVVVGNGIAGVTAADYVRRLHPACSIDVIAEETHNLYNRMAISRLIYGRSAMQGLYLNADSWYEDHAITSWLNTRVRAIDRDAGVVLLATGEKLPYDRLILATGSSSHVPRLDGWGVPGGFVLRSAADALQMRAFAQLQGARRAVVAGGGLLGLEAAYALHKLGLATTVLERSERLLRRQLDEPASALLERYIEGLGITVRKHAETAAVLHNGHVEGVTLKDGTSLAAEVLVVAAGIVPNVDLAQGAGLAVGRGVTVDRWMRTSDERIFAAGDVAEHEGTVYGLWPVAVEQAQVAADAAVSQAEKAYTGSVPMTILKVVGIELTSIGRIEPESEADEVIIHEDAEALRYGKLIISDARIVGAILLGYSREVSPVTTAVKQGWDVSSKLPDLRAGRYEVLEDLARGGAMAPASVLGRAIA